MRPWPPSSIRPGWIIVLVSDAVGTVGNGRPEAVSVTVDEMIYHTRAVRNGVKRCLVVTTLPFGSYSSPEDAVRTATRLMKEGGADGVHFEGTSPRGRVDPRHHGRRHPGDGARRRHQAEDRQRGPHQPARARTPRRPGEIIADAVEMANNGALRARPGVPARPAGPDHHPEPRHPDHRDRLGRRLRRPGAGHPGHVGALQRNVAPFPQGLRRPGEGHRRRR